ncbi:MAG: hypothetical protein M1816_000126 [Peltula sp. TS41687]|nr:MAG: hypothetical protein M1816_000126 [Peltula sp. TS41687]
MMQASFKPTNWLLLALGGLQLSSASPLVERDATCKQADVAILGGGTAGIMAAKTLTQQSVTNFFIVEYTGDIGGRMLPTSFGVGNQKRVVELGANWVQGLGGNPVWQSAQKYGLANTYSDYSSLKTFDASGATDYTKIAEEYGNANSAAFAKAGAALKTNVQDRTFRDALRQEGWDPTGDPKKKAIEWYLFDFEYAKTPEQSSHIYSVVNYNDTFYQWTEENNLSIDQRGFKSWLKGEASTFLKPNDPRLLLNTVVTGVSYDNDGVTVHNKDGSCVRAKYALCTFSLGVLQKNAVAFSPGLPQWKKTGISKFDIGTYTKIYIQFPADKVFWDKNTQFFLYADPNTRGRYPLFQNLDSPGFFPGSGILFVTVTDTEAYRVENQSDDKTKAEVLAVLRTMFGKDKVPDPIDFLVPRWTSTPWAYGSYSNWPPGVTIEQHQNLRANVGKLWFAGEATSVPYFGFLQGAYTEGQTAANAIAACVKGKCVDQPHYEVVPTSSSKNNFNAANGWTVDSTAFAPKG